MIQGAVSSPNSNENNGGTAQAFLTELYLLWEFSVPSNSGRFYRIRTFVTFVYSYWSTEKGCNVMRFPVHEFDPTDDVSVAFL